MQSLGRRLPSIAWLIRGFLVGGIGAGVVLAGCFPNCSTAPSSFLHLTLAPASAVVDQGASTTNVLATGTASDGIGGVGLDATADQTGITLTSDARQVNGNVSTQNFVIHVAASVPAGTYPVHFTARQDIFEGNLADQKDFSLTLTAPGSFGLASSVTSMSVLQGANSPSTITIGRNNFTGTINFQLENIPAGVTASFSPVSTSGTTTALTVIVDRTTGPGTYTIVVRGTSGTTTATASIQLTVTGFSLEVQPTSLTVPQGSTNTATVTIHRASGYLGTVSLAAEDLPSGVSATFNPQSTTGTTSVVIFTAGLTAQQITRTVTIRGTTPAAIKAGGTVARITDQTVSLSLTVGPPGSAVSVDFTGCDVSSTPTWFAYQDGGPATPWTRLVSSGSVYAFSITQDKAGIAYTTAGFQPEVTVYYLTRAELTATSPFRFCHASGTKTVNGSLAGLNIGETTNFSLGGASTLVTANTQFQLTQVADGVRDLIWYKITGGSIGASDLIGYRRIQNIATGGTLDPVTLPGAESFPTATALMAVANAGGQNTTHDMFYLTGANCDFAGLYFGQSVTAASFTARGARTTEQSPTDFHRVSVTAIGPGSPVTSFRQLMESFHTLAPRTLTFGDALATPVISTLVGGAYLRLQEVVTIAPEYGTKLVFSYMASVAGTTHVATITATLGWLGSATNATLGMPDLSVVTAFPVTVPPPTGSSGNWSVAASNLTAVSSCTEGGRMLSATRLGTF